MWYSIILNIILLKSIFCTNILIVNDTPSPSHQIWNFAYAKGLIENDHNVTMLSTQITKNVNHTNFHQIYLEGIKIKKK